MIIKVSLSLYILLIKSLNKDMKSYTIYIFTEKGDFLKSLTKITNFKVYKIILETFL